MDRLIGLGGKAFYLAKENFTRFFKEKKRLSQAK